MNILNKAQFLNAFCYGQLPWQRCNRKCYFYSLEFVRLSLLKRLQNTRKTSSVFRFRTFFLFFMFRIRYFATFNFDVFRINNSSEYLDYTLTVILLLILSTSILTDVLLKFNRVNWKLVIDLRNRLWSSCNSNISSHTNELILCLWGCKYIVHRVHWVHISSTFNL